MLVKIILCYKLLYVIQVGDFLASDDIKAFGRTYLSAMLFLSYIFKDDIYCNRTLTLSTLIEQLAIILSAINQNFDNI